MKILAIRGKNLASLSSEFAVDFQTEPLASAGLFAITGPTGMLAYGDYKRQLAQRQAVYAKLDQQRAVMKNRVELLDPRKADPDMVDELVRKKLNVVRPDEVVVPLKN